MSEIRTGNQTAPNQTLNRVELGLIGVAAAAGTEYFFYNHRVGTELTDTGMSLGASKHNPAFDSLERDADPTDFYLEATSTTVLREQDGKTYTVTVTIPHEQAGQAGPTKGLFAQREFNRTQQAVDGLVSSVEASDATVTSVKIDATASDLMATQGTDRMHPYGLGKKDSSQQQAAEARADQAADLLAASAQQHGVTLAPIHAEAKEFVVSKEHMAGIRVLARRLAEDDGVASTLKSYVHAYDQYPNATGVDANRPAMHKAAPELENGNNTTITMTLVREPNLIDGIAHTKAAPEGVAVASAVIAILAAKKAARWLRSLVAR